VIAPAELESLTTAERIQTMEMLWDLLSRDPAAVPSPDWHAEVLSDRLAKVKSGQAQFLTLPQLKERLGQK
jgi:putative addiction module component (TIGR02574 family)